jgi:hypothetical protein
MAYAPVERLKYFVFTHAVHACSHHQAVRGAARTVLNLNCEFWAPAPADASLCLLLGGPRGCIHHTPAIRVQLEWVPDPFLLRMNTMFVVCW